ncbi:MAG: hypothetical protein FWB90_10145, partial [Fibromonadales bacterium]|nr:hypothetical protein [Fibromonadales bacterium]
MANFCENKFGELAVQASVAIICLPKFARKRPNQPLFLQVAKNVSERKESDSRGIKSLLKGKFTPPPPP